MFIWLVGINGFLGWEITETPIAWYPLFTDLIKELPKAALGSFFPLIEEKFTAQLSKKLPPWIVKVIPPPPSDLFHSSRVIMAFFYLSNCLKDSIMPEWDCLNIVSNWFIILVSNNCSSIQVYNSWRFNITAKFIIIKTNVFLIESLH